MYKSNSHIGSFSSKKKKHNDFRKKAKTPEDRLLKFINEEKTRINNLMKTNEKNYPSFHYKCSDVAEIIGTGYLEVVKAAISLSHKRLVTWPSGRTNEQYFYIRGIDYYPEKNVEIPLKIYYKLDIKGDNCPVCESKMPNQFYNALEKTLTRSCKFECSNGCFSYNGHVESEYHNVSVFDKKYSISNKTHKSIRNSQIHEVEKEVYKMKKDYRYLAEILERK